jgi:hypothetical protein
MFPRLLTATIIILLGLTALVDAGIVPVSFAWASRQPDHIDILCP